MNESLFEQHDPAKRYFAAMWPTGGGDELCYRTMMVNKAIIRSAGTGASFPALTGLPAPFPTL